MKMLAACFLALMPPLAAGAAAALPASASAPQLSRERIVFRTNVGDIAVALYPSVAPQTSAQILNLARKGVFDGVTIYRVEPGFVAQIENYDVRKPVLSPAQSAEIRKIPGEFSSVHHRRGILSMARYDDPNSAEASFSFVLGEAPSLDKTYAVFGEVVDGLDVLTEFEKNATSGPDGKPRLMMVTRADVYEDGNLANAKLEKAHEWEGPDAGIGRAFLIFAIIAFVITILKPIIDGLRTKPAHKPA